MRRPSEAWLTREMSMVFYQLSSRSGMHSPCPLSTCDSLQLHLVGFSGQKAHGGQAVSAPRCVAVPKWVLHKGWERSCSCSYFCWHGPRVLPGTQGGAPPWGWPITQPLQTESHALLFLAGWEGSEGTCAAPQSHHGFFFQNRDLHSQTKSSSFTLCHRSFLPLEEQNLKSGNNKSCISSVSELQRQKLNLACLSGLSFTYEAFLTFLQLCHTHRYTAWCVSLETIRIKKSYLQICRAISRL